MSSGEIFIETKRIGAIFNVRAVDAASGTEVSFQVPVSTPREGIQRLAVNKLTYVLKKK